MVHSPRSQHVYHFLRGGVVALEHVLPLPRRVTPQPFSGLVHVWVNHGELLMIPIVSHSVTYYDIRLAGYIEKFSIRF